MHYTMRRITQPPRHHFFGYYDLPCWDAAGRYHLAMEVDFMDRPPTGEDTAIVGVVDLEGGDRYTPLARTRAWNFQQGCFAQWLAGRQRTIIYNDRRDGQFVCVTHELGAGRERVHGPAVAAVSEDGRLGATLNFARIAVTRPGYGYEGLADPWHEQNMPEKDGLGILDLATGRHRLIVSFADLAPLQAAEVGWGQDKTYFNHVLFNPSGTRLSVIVRQVVPRPGQMPSWWTQLWTFSADGSVKHHCLDRPMVSHYDWKDDDTVIAWAQVGGVDGVWELDALGRTPPRRLFAETITRDGHIAYSHDRRHIVCDTYPDQAGLRELFLAPYPGGEELSLGRYYSPTPRHVDIRCDFHPSFSADDRQIAFDGMHEGTRQRYIVTL